MSPEVSQRACAAPCARHVPKLPQHYLSAVLSAHGSDQVRSVSTSAAVAGSSRKVLDADSSANTANPATAKDKSPNSTTSAGARAEHQPMMNAAPRERVSRALRTRSASLNWICVLSLKINVREQIRFTSRHPNPTRLPLDRERTQNLVRQADERTMGVESLQWMTGPPRCRCLRPSEYFKPAGGRCALSSRFVSERRISYA